MTLYCPMCGETLQDSDGHLTCVSGGMVLTEHMETLLGEAFGSPSGRTDSTPLNYRVGGTWFCPACGVSLAENDGILGCPRCGRSLNRFIYHLVERHPHKPGSRS
jgi:uncharacterized Zn finger protein (UPF0148 family)